MDIADVMRQAVSSFAPVAEQEQYAIDAALAAAERLLTGLGIGRYAVNWSELRTSALEIWTSYCEAALNAEFVVTSLCRNDLVAMGASEAQARMVSDEDMRAIAKKMEEGYVGIGVFWSDLAGAVNERLEAQGFPLIQFSEKE